jgi:UPF0716 protein FxsA
MWFGLFLIFVAVPLMELALLIKVGTWIGFWPTFGIVVLTALAGAAVLNSQGLKTMQRAMADLQKGAPPVQSVVDGSFMLLAGMLLVLPGLITDCLGLLLLIPPVRRVVGRWSLRRFLSSANVHTSTYTESWTDGQRGSGPKPKVNERWEAQQRQQPGAGTVIDGEYVRIDETTVTPGGRAPERPARRDRTATDADHKPASDVPRRPGADTKI